MIATIHTLVFLLAVIAAVAFAATRLKVPPSILLVLTGVVSRAHSRSADRRDRA